MFESNIISVIRLLREERCSSSHDLINHELEEIKMKLIIKHEEEKDFNQIHHFIEDAFKTADISDGDEQNFVNTLRQSENYIPQLALVAFDDNQLVGHIMLTKFATEKMLLLAPLTVDIHYRGQGIGTMLVKKAFELAKEMNYTSVIVLGAPSYYSRFGFKPSINFGITCTNPIPPQYVQAVELVESSLDSANLTITF